MKEFELEKPFSLKEGETAKLENSELRIKFFGWVKCIEIVAPYQVHCINTADGGAMCGVSLQMQLGSQMEEKTLARITLQPGKKGKKALETDFCGKPFLEWEGFGIVLESAKSLKEIVLTVLTAEKALAFKEKRK